MDLIFLLVPVLLAIFSPLAILFFAHGSKPKPVATEKGLPPPGSFGWPIIGETIQFMVAMQKGSAAEFIKERTEKYSSHVFKTSLLGEKIVVFAGQAGNKFIFTNENKLFTPYLATSTRKLFPSLDFANLGARKHINVLFKSDAIQRLVASLDCVSRTHLNRYWVGKDEVKAHQLIKLYAITAACGSFMGMEDVDDHISKFLKHFNILNAGLFSVPLYIPGTSFYRAANAAKALRKEIDLIIKQKKKAMSQNSTSPAHDILSQMMWEEGETMTELEMADKILFFLVSGNVTTTAVITSTMKYLAENPDFYNEILKEQMEIARLMKPREVLCWDDIQKMRYTWNYVSEVMRVLPTVQGALRETKIDFTYEGFDIPKGWKVFWSPGVTHKDQEYFPKPEKFDPSRFEEKGPCPYTYIPFGAGPHMCPGREYARLKILVFLHNAIKTFRWETMVPGEKIVFDSVPIPAAGLPVRLFPL